MKVSNLPESVYIHIPFCKSKCLYCGFFSKPPAQFDVQKLLNAELEELKNFSFAEPVKTLYVGGGSPASIGSSALCGFLCEITKLTGKPQEFTAEINPADVNELFLRRLYEVGVNRISIGVQSFNEDELLFLGRRYTPAQAEQIIELCKKIGFTNIGIDLIFAVPGSNLKTWQQNLARAVRNNIQHISTYSLTYETDTPLEKIKSLGKIKIVNEELDRLMYERAIWLLEQEGFDHYEISNFAKPGFACEHNLAYWKNDYYIGIGPSACGYIKNLRYENIDDIEKYIQQTKKTASKTEITSIEKACQTAVLGLRLINGIDLSEYKQKTGFDITELFEKSLEKNLKHNLLQIKDNRLSLTRAALAIADTVLCDFAEPDKF